MMKNGYNVVQTRIKYILVFKRKTKLKWRSITSCLIGVGA